VHFWVGGGDIFIQNSVDGPLVFRLSSDEDDDNDTGDGNNDPRTETAKNVSPKSAGTSKVATLSIEGKQGSGKIDDQIYQL